MTPTPALHQPRVRRLGLVGGGLAVAVVALAVLVSGPWTAPGSVPASPGDPGTAACVEPYNGPASIAGRTVAFDGTVTAIDGERVTFDVNDAFRGVDTPTVTLEAPGMTGPDVTSVGGPNLMVGGRYLVAGDGGFAWACGYTQAYDATLAAQWAAAAAG